MVSLVAFLSCKAQSPIVNLDARISNTPNGAYFKDVNEELNKFEGEWKYSMGSIVFTIILQKKTMLYDGEHYEDLLIGEYKYLSNGITLVNTLALLDDISIVGGYHNISGRTISYNDDSPICSDCNKGERRINLFFDDPDRPYLSASITIRYIQGTDPEQIRVKLIGGESTILPDENSPELMRVPNGTYIMTKQ